jgi:hypothetical protein
LPLFTLPLDFLPSFTLGFIFCPSFLWHLMNCPLASIWGDRKILRTVLSLAAPIWNS